MTEVQSRMRRSSIARAKRKTKMASGGEPRTSRRDNFPQSVIQILFKRSGGRCCKCGATTFGPHTGRLDKYQNIGQAAHIAAAAPGGPRYNPRMQSEERMSAKNGLWLCSNCHSLMDRDTEEFTLPRLRQIKKEGEERARMDVGVATTVPSSDRVDETSDILRASISATTIVEIRKVKSSLLQLHGQKVGKDDVEQFLEDISFINFETDTYRPEVGTELLAFFSKLATYCTDAEINLEVIRQFKFILEKFDPSWSGQDVELVANTLYAMTGTFTKRSRVFQSAVALLKDLTRSKALRSNKFHTIPLELLKDIQQEGRNKRKREGSNDDVDYPAKLQRQEDSAGVVKDPATATEDDTGGVEPDSGADFVDYMESMVELAEASDEKIQQLESALIHMGYEPNII